MIACTLLKCVSLPPKAAMWKPFLDFLVVSWSWNALFFHVLLLALHCTAPDHALLTFGIAGELFLYASTRSSFVSKSPFGSEVKIAPLKTVYTRAQSIRIYLPFCRSFTLVLLLSCDKYLKPLHFYGGGVGHLLLSPSLFNLRNISAKTFTGPFPFHSNALLKCNQRGKNRIFEHSYYSWLDNSKK